MPLFLTRGWESPLRLLSVGDVLNARLAGARGRYLLQTVLLACNDMFFCICVKLSSDHGNPSVRR